MIESNDFGILPYTELNGKPTISEERFVGMYWSMRALYPYIFVDGSLDTVDDFINHATSKDVHFFLVTFLSNPALIIWFNRLQITHAYGHWCWIYTSLSYKDKVTASKWAMREVFKILAEYTVLLGQIPTENQKAIDFSKHVGMHELGNVPGLIYHAESGKHIDGTVLYLERKDVKDENIYEDYVRHRYPGDIERGVVRV